MAGCDLWALKGSCSFLKKRTKKLLSVSGHSWGATENEQKFFASFFQKRSPSSFFRNKKSPGASPLDLVV
jgi:hypothetical protein